MQLDVSQTLRSRFILSFLILVILPVFTISFLVSLRFYRTLLDVQLERIRFSSLEIAADIEEEAESIALKTSVLPGLPGEDHAWYHGRRRQGLSNFWRIQS